MPGRRLIPLPSICETPRSSRGLRVSSFEPRLKAQEFGLWHPLDSWLIPHVEPLAGSAPGIDCVSMRAALLREGVDAGEGSSPGRSGVEHRTSSGVNANAECGHRQAKKSQNPHPLVRQTPKGCGTQERLLASRVLHPSFQCGRRRVSGESQRRHP